VAEEDIETSPWKRKVKSFWEAFKRSRLGMTGLILLLIFLIIAITAPIISPYPVYGPEARVGTPFEPPSSKHWLGCDELGRDLFSQLLWGTQVSLFVGFLAALMATFIGLVIGIISGYFGGIVDDLLMRITDIILVIPGLPFMIILAAVLGPSIINIVFVIGILGWTGTARLIRSQVLSLKERPFVEAARAAGASDAHIMFKHIMPNVMPLAFAQMILGVSGAILSEAGLSFLGLGDPSHISWGMMLQSAYLFGALHTGAWWYIIPPGIMITAVVVAFTFMGYAFDEILNPRYRRRR